jgi:hypothetical protein
MTEFLRKIQKMHFPPKMGESKNQWYHQKVLLKHFPMNNGHVRRFRKSKIFWAISVSHPQFDLCN